MLIKRFEKLYDSPSMIRILFLVFLGMARVNIGKDEMTTFVVFWFLLGTVVDLVAVAWAETKLRFEFRRTATLGQAIGGAEVFIHKPKIYQTGSMREGFAGRRPKVLGEARPPRGFNGAMTEL